MQDVLTKLQTAQAELDPQFKALKNVMGGLQGAIRLASAEKADALPMNKALSKLETAASQVPNESLQTAVAAFSAATQSALDGLAYDFAKDLRDTFSARGLSVEGRPPTLTVGLLTLKIDIAARKGQWLYGREALTNPIPLSLAAIVKAYDQQAKRIANRSIDGSALLQEIYKAWSDLIAEKARRPAGTSRGHASVAGVGPQGADAEQAVHPGGSPGVLPPQGDRRAPPLARSRIEDSAASC